MRSGTLRDSEASGEADPVSDIPEQRFLRSWTLEKRRAFDDAENLIREDGATSSSVVELDLLAGIAANGGKFDLSERL